MRKQQILRTAPPNRKGRSPHIGTPATMPHATRYQRSEENPRYTPARSLSDEPPLKTNTCGTGAARLPHIVDKRFCISGQAFLYTERAGREKGQRPRPPKTLGVGRFSYCLFCSARPRR